MLLPYRILKTRLLAYLREHENPRSRQEIADILGVARPSLARVLSELADEGYTPDRKAENHCRTA